MKKLIIILLACLMCGNAFEVEAQSAKRSAKKSTEPTAKETVADKRPVVIAVEAGQVYVDLLDVPVVAGDRIVVYKNDTYFIHPVTKERIPRDMQDIAELEVVKVFTSYIQTVPKPSMAISLIKPGMTVRKGEQPAVAYEPVVVDTPQLSEQQLKEQRVLDAVAEANKGLPSKKKDNQALLEITVDGKTIYYHHLITSKIWYKSVKKSIEKDKFYKEKILNGLRMTPFYVQAKDAGYAVVDRWWSPDKSDHIDYTIISNATSI